MPNQSSKIICYFCKEEKEDLRRFPLDRFTLLLICEECHKKVKGTIEEWEWNELWDLKSHPLMQ